MLSAVLGRAVLEPAVSGGLVYTYVTLEDAANVRPEEVESVVDIVRTTSEAEVAAVFKAAGPDEWTVSLRSESTVDVKNIAVALGGGGHRRAAGYTAFGSIPVVVEALLATLKASSP
jgi:phosphoesterase RecJ-like protein